MDGNKSNQKPAVEEIAVESSMVTVAIPALMEPKKATAILAV